MVDERVWIEWQLLGALSNGQEVDEIHPLYTNGQNIFSPDLRWPFTLLASAFERDAM